MRTEPPSPLASALARLRGVAGRTRRWLVARGTGTRVALLMAGLAALGAAGYLTSGFDQGEPAWDWIYQHRRLSGDDVVRISEALDRAGITHFADPRGRIGVKPAQKHEALAALDKAKVRPPSLDDLAAEVDAGNPLLDLPGDRERRDNLQLERVLKLQIEQLDAIESALVRISRARRRVGAANAPEVSVSVYVETEGRQELRHRVVESIEGFLTKDLRGLSPEAIYIVDSTGRAYLNPGDPSLKAKIHQHAREEDWQDQILQELRHIPGVGVLGPARSCADAPARARAAAGGRDRAGQPQRPGPALPTPRPRRSRHLRRRTPPGPGRTSGSASPGASSSSISSCVTPAGCRPRTSWIRCG